MLGLVESITILNNSRLFGNAVHAENFFQHLVVYVFRSVPAPAFPGLSAASDPGLGAGRALLEGAFVLRRLPSCADGGGTGTKIVMFIGCFRGIL